MPDFRPFCTGCKKHPDEIEEYQDPELLDPGQSPDDYVRADEGTYNRENGHFLCTGCYIEAGMPSKEWPDRWVAP